MKQILQVVVVAFVCLSAQAQVNSGSDGHDGAFNPTANTVINMANHPDGIYHYTSVNIPTNVTVSFIPNANNTPVVWLVQSNVIINGTVDVSGKNGNHGTGGAGGPGGWRGGNGGLPPSPGQGPGGGISGVAGEGASFGSLGTKTNGGFLRTGPTYGNSFLIPLLGGSGGGGSTSLTGEGAGGGGGGALLIATASSLSVNGSIYSGGGAGHYVYNYGAGGGGGGSGGAVRLVASTILGSGTIGVGSSVIGSPGGYGGSGRVRFDTYENDFGGKVYGSYANEFPITQGYQPIILPTAWTGAQLAIASVAGVPVAATPTGMLATPDAVLAAQQANPVAIAVRCLNLPLNTPITVSVKPMSGSPVSAMGYNTSGTLANSTATVLVNMPRGGGLIYATAATSN